MEVSKPYDEKPTTHERWVEALYRDLRETVKKLGISYVWKLDSLRALYGNAILKARTCDAEGSLAAASGTMYYVLKLHEALDEAKYIGKITEDEYKKAEDQLTDMHDHAIIAIKQVLAEECSCQWHKL